MKELEKKKKIIEISTGITMAAGILFSIFSGVSRNFSIFQMAVVSGVLFSVVFLQFLWLYWLQQQNLEQKQKDYQEQVRAILRSWRHDFLNDLQMLLTLVQMKKYSRQMEYIKEITEKIHETGNILRTADVPLALFFLRQYRKMGEINVDLKVILESDLGGIPEKSRFTLFKNMFGLVKNPQKEEKECLLLVSDQQEEVKIYFNFPGDREGFDWQKYEGIKKVIADQSTKIDLTFEEEEATLQILFRLT